MLVTFTVEHHSQFLVAWRLRLMEVDGRFGWYKVCPNNADFNDYATATVRSLRRLCRISNCVCLNDFNLVNLTLFSAKLGGATRLEICGNLGIGGGTTPSFGLVKAIRAAVSDLPLMVLYTINSNSLSY